MRYKYALIILLFVSFFSGSFIVHAQSSELLLQTIPQFPGPNTDVVVRVVNYSANLDTATFTWSLDGKTIKKGIGEKQFSFKTKGVGSQSVINVVVSPTQGADLEKQIVITPSAVDLLWDADTYTHPFYEGRAGYSYGSLVTITALPQFSVGDVLAQSKRLVYKWSINGNVFRDSSGYGKNYFTIPAQGSVFPVRVEVEVSSVDGTMTAKSEITLTPSRPLVLVYENNPLYGVLYQKAFGATYDLPGNESTVSAMPYFFSTLTRTSGIMQYDWTLNGEDLGTEYASDITLRRPPENTGASQISVRVKNIASILQDSNTDFSVLYQ